MSVTNACAERGDASHEPPFGGSGTCSSATAVPEPVYVWDATERRIRYVPPGVREARAANDARLITNVAFTAPVGENARRLARNPPSKTSGTPASEVTSHENVAFGSVVCPLNAARTAENLMVCSCTSGTGPSTRSSVTDAVAKRPSFETTTESDTKASPASARVESESVGFLTAAISARRFSSEDRRHGVPPETVHSHANCSAGSWHATAVTAPENPPADSAGGGQMSGSAELEASRVSVAVRETVRAAPPAMRARRGERPTVKICDADADVPDVRTPRRRT
mmetsp:Transcript_19063/g.42892  ORF Transcript_19063/g.42892 Transcript_19063/m.42892 type:complete len:283 (-) Transcript_19063:959-1807(-)